MFIAIGPLALVWEPTNALKSPFAIKESKLIQALKVNGRSSAVNPKSLGITSLLLDPLNFPAKPYLPWKLKSTFVAVPL